jgi:rhamnogalacturonan endolyase
MRKPRASTLEPSFTLFACALGLVFALVGCNASTGDGGASGGATASGGSKSSGGATGSTASTGGGGGSSTGSGGATVAGGTSGSGGTGGTATGGSRASGGTSGSGGSDGGPDATTDGRRDGGSDVAGSTGGAPATGGSRATGGASGGITGAGGVTGSGGTTATGGSGPAGSCAPPTGGHYQMEDIDRGVVAVKVAAGVYVGWRMMGYEYDPANPTHVAYNVYRAGTKVATVTDSTNYLDASGTATSSYTVAAVLGGTECEQSPAATPWAQNYLSVPLQVPANAPTGATYSAGDASTGDLDGDGRYDIVLKWDPSDQQDSSKAGKTGNVYLDGITLDGKRLWRIDLGINIRAGAHDTQFSVYDFDGDGKAEVACKTAPGTKDGTGAYLGNGPAASDDDSKDYRNADGWVLTGPEYLTVFDGTTGKERATVAYPVARNSNPSSADVSAWGDNYGNRVNRFNGGVSFVKEGGVATGKPSIIAQRGYYTRMTIGSYLFRGGALTRNWLFDSNASGNSAAAGQGNHQCMTADVDNDGAMEIIPGSATINSDGTLRCTTKMGHGDALHVGELIKGKGIHVFMPHEGEGGQDCHDASTCKFAFQVVGGDDNGRGVAEWVSMSQTKSASCSSAKGGNQHCSDGATGAVSAGSNFLIYWDADEARELLDGVTISKAGGGTLLSPGGTAACNGTKNTPNLTADLLGDWREELIVHTTDSKALRIYTTTEVTKRRIYTLMHDPTYRMQLSFQQSSYNQPPHVGFMIGPGMADPPKPDIHVK